VTLFAMDKRLATAELSPGECSYIPRNCGHAIHNIGSEDCEVVVAACHVDLLTFLDSVPTFSKLPVAFERDEALALLLERPVETSR